MSDAGHIKHNPQTGDVAVRTGFSETDFPEMVWLVASVNRGARNAREEDVKDWDDLFTPPPPADPVDASDPATEPPAADPPKPVGAAKAKKPDTVTS